MGPDPSVENRVWQQENEARQGYRASVQSLEEGKLPPHSNNVAIANTVIMITS